MSRCRHDTMWHTDDQIERDRIAAQNMADLLQARANTRALRRLDTNTSYHGTSHRHQHGYETNIRPTTAPTGGDQFEEYRPRRARLSLLQPSRSTRGHREVDYSRPVNLRDHRHMSFDPYALDDSVIVSQSYHQMRKPLRAVDEDDWVPSPASSYDKVYDDNNSSVSDLSDELPSAPNGKPLPPTEPKSPVFRPTLEKYSDLYYDPDPVNNHQPHEVQLTRGRKAHPPKPKAKHRHEVQVRAPKSDYASNHSSDVSDRGDREFMDKPLPSPPRKTKSKKHKVHACAVM